MEPERLEVAVRAWTTSPSDRYRQSPYAPWTDPVGPSEWVLVFDCETFTDQAQQLRFGCSRLYAGPVLHRAAVFYDPGSVTDEELDVLKQTAADNGWEITEVSQWIEEVFFAAAVDLSATVVGHNLFFDMTRIAIGHDTTRSRDPRMRGGFSLKLTDDPTRPRVLVKKVSSSAVHPIHRAGRPIARTTSSRERLSPTSVPRLLRRHRQSWQLSPQWEVEPGQTRRSARHRTSQVSGRP